MEFGFHVDVEEGCEKFLKRLAKAGVKIVKLHIPPTTKRKTVKSVCKFLYDNKMKAYVTLFTINQTPIQHDPVFPYLTFNRDKLYDRYEDVIKWLSPKTPIVGIGLIEHIEMAIRDIPGSTHGISRKDVKIIQNEISNLIGDSFPRVLNCRPEDVEAGHWREVDFDIYDFSGEVSSYWDGNIKTILPKTSKEIWVSEVRVHGGFLTELQQIKLVKAARDVMKSYPYVFLYSKGVNGFKWDGVIDKLPLKGDK